MTALHPAERDDPAASAEEPFYIPVTGPTSRPRRALKYGDIFAVIDSHGDIGASSGGHDGIFHADTRYLSRFELLINGQQPLLLGSNVRDDNTVLTVDLTNPDIFFEQHLILPKDTVHISRTLFLWRGSAYQRVGVRNHGERRLDLSLSFTFDSDFADVFEVRGLHRARRGTQNATVDAATGRVTVEYDGLDERRRRSVLVFDPPPAKLHRNLASYSLSLERGERCAIYLTLECEEDRRTRPRSFFFGMLKAARELKRATRHIATAVTSNEVFNQVLCRSASDLYMLMTNTAQGPYPYAGIPWYSTTFGRDGLITAIQMLWCDPGIARGVLRRLAAFQARQRDPENDAEPGKILHEMRSGEMAALREVPFGLYYGTVDATPLFVLLAGLYVERTGDIATLRELWPNMQAALAWIDQYGDRDGDGFVEYHRATEEGLVNQGWKDSQDAVFEADGRLADGPIALAEVQGYVYAAKLAAAHCARRLGCDAEADRLEAAALTLAERFDKAFWCEDIGTYALALNGQKRPCRVRTSNAGQVLFTGIATPEHALSVARQLIEPRFFTGWGIRTVARDESRYNPMSYHNGSVWPHDNALIAMGFSRYGFAEGVDRICTGMMSAAGYMDFRRLPELFCGFRRNRGRGPTLYPVACSPQAWAAATPFALLHAALGFEFDADRKEIRLRNPHLPSDVGDLTIRDLRLGEGSVDLVLRGRGNDVSLRVLRSDGGVRVSAVFG
ncbi:MAG TPA: amylo-alpha-1,6-glucosidase [Xanthobacteraceae bacterium]|nr:amylo-alpha-1,6-glucosidase [Xanthobacteraceae bacterium]